MRLCRISIFGIFSAVVFVPVHADGLCTFQQESSVPRQAPLTLPTGLEISCHLNPFYQRGDFDGDGKADLAILVIDKKSGKKGIAVFFSTTKPVALIGAGREVGNGGDDFEWMDAWSVSPAPSAESWGAPVPHFKGEVLYVEKTESASAYVGWTDVRFEWLQAGD